MKEFPNKESSGSSVGKLEITRAKTQIQLSRNAALRQAEEILNKDSRIKNKKEEVIWQKEDKKNRTREVHVDSRIIFIQSKDDLTGNFLDEFANLRI